MTSKQPAPQDPTHQAHLLTAQEAIVDGERDIRIPFGPTFACTFSQIQAGAASMTSDPLHEAPKQIFALAEGIRSSLIEVHQKLGHQVAYEIKEKTLQLPNSDLASRFVVVAQSEGEVLPEDVKRAVAERFFEESFTAKYSLQDPVDEIYEIPAEVNDALFRMDPDYDYSCCNPAPKRLEIPDVPDLERLVADAVAVPALDFARAHAGKLVKCKVVTPAGEFDIEGKAAPPQTKWESAGPITLVRQIDGLVISDHKVKFAMPNHCFERSDDRSGNGPESMPDNFFAAIGKGEGSDVPPEPLLTQVRQFIGANALLVRIRVEVIAVGSRIGFQLVQMEREVVPEFYVPRYLNVQ